MPRRKARDDDDGDLAEKARKRPKMKAVAAIFAAATTNTDGVAGHQTPDEAATGAQSRGSVPVSKDDQELAGRIDEALAGDLEEQAVLTCKCWWKPCRN
jgi:hypothetical protein